MTLTVIDAITAAGVVQFSPANTSLALTDYDDKGLYFRNAPPDGLQGAVVADLVLEDGNASAYILDLDDAYGNGLADVDRDVLTDAGVEVLGTIIYDPTAAELRRRGRRGQSPPTRTRSSLITLRRGQPHPADDGRAGHRPDRQERLRHRRQHGQRPRRELRRRDLSPDDLDELTEAPG